MGTILLMVSAVTMWQVVTADTYTGMCCKGGLGAFALGATAAVLQWALTGIV